MEGVWRPGAQGSQSRGDGGQSLVPHIFRYQAQAARCEGLWRERKSQSYKSNKRHVTQEDMIYQGNQRPPEEEIGNLNKQWKTYPGTWAITAGHRWMVREKTEESSVSHESEMGRYVRANSPGYTRACAATIGPRWKVSRDMRAMSLE